MPKIEAATVRAHRAQRLERLIDAAESILAERGVEALTAGAVAARAGIARNSIYRYFSSIDDLLELVVTRTFPSWVAGVEAAIAAESVPEERVVAYVRANVEQAASSTHGWRTSLSRGSLSESARERVRALHVSLIEALVDAVADLGVEQAELTVSVIQALVDSSIRQIDSGASAGEVSRFAVNATRRLVHTETT